MNIIDIEGIGPVYTKTLSEIGIQTTGDLLENGGDRAGRKKIEQRTGISGTLIMEWVNLADLIRIEGIGEEYSDLLEEAGVDTVRELRNRNPENLFNALVEVNKEKKLVRRLPSLDNVKDWVVMAKTLEPAVTY